MDPPLEKVPKLSVHFSFTSSRAIFRIHVRSGIWGERIAWFSGGMERGSEVSYKF